MSSTDVKTGGTARTRRRSVRPGAMTPGSTLGLGIAMVWFSLLVLIPLGAIVVEASGGGLDT